MASCLPGNALHQRVCAELDVLLRDVYQFQFALCEESQIMSKHIKNGGIGHVVDQVDADPVSASEDVGMSGDEEGSA